MKIFSVFSIMLSAVRPSRVEDMHAEVNSFWIRKGFDGLTFFGTILTPSQELADSFNNASNSVVGDLQSAQMKNHEMIHLRQAQSCGDSWIRFYLLYIWYWFKIACFGRFGIKHAAYLLNPFEMEAYLHMNDLNYLNSVAGDTQSPANEWRKYAKMSIKERLLVLHPVLTHL